MQTITYMLHLRLSALHAVATPVGSCYAIRIHVQVPEHSRHIIPTPSTIGAPPKCYTSCCITAAAAAAAAASCTRLCAPSMQPPGRAAHRSAQRGTCRTRAAGKQRMGSAQCQCAIQQVWQIHVAVRHLRTRAAQQQVTCRKRVRDGISRPSRAAQSDTCC
jgi:hypothetical protein